MNKSMVIKGLAVAAILFFFLPFFTVSCNYEGSQDLVTMNGVKLVTGVKNGDMDIEGLESYMDIDGDDSEVAFKGNVAAILLILLPIGILVVSFMKLKNNEIMTLIAAGVCFLLVFYLRSDVVSKATDGMEGYISVKNQIGYYLTILVHLGIIGFVVYDKFIAKMMKKPTTDGASPVIPSNTGDQA